jgi:hypothetical protein
MNPRMGRAVADIVLPSREPFTLTLDLGVPCSGRVEITPDPGADINLWLSLVDTRNDNNYENFGWQSLEKGDRDFEVIGVPPGSYSAQLYVGNGKNAQCNFDLGQNGDDHLVLRFTLK